MDFAGVNLLFQGGNIGGTFRRLGRRRLLQLGIFALQLSVLPLQRGVFALQIVVFALGDAAREEDSGRAEQEPDPTLQTTGEHGETSQQGSGTEAVAYHRRTARAAAHLPPSRRAADARPWRHGTSSEDTS